MERRTSGFASATLEFRGRGWSPAWYDYVIAMALMIWSILVIALYLILNDDAKRPEPSILAKCAEIERALENALDRGGLAWNDPHPIDTLIAAGYLRADKLTDPWGEFFVAEWIAESFSVKSKGPDRILGTEDDIGLQP